MFLELSGSLHASHRHISHLKLDPGMEYIFALDNAKRPKAQTQNFLRKSFLFFLFLFFVGFLFCIFCYTYIFNTNYTVTCIRRVCTMLNGLSYYYFHVFQRLVYGLKRSLNEIKVLGKQIMTLHSN